MRERLPLGVILARRSVPSALVPSSRSRLSIADCSLFGSLTPDMMTGSHGSPRVLRAKSAISQTRIIRRAVLSLHVGSAVVAAKIAAVRHACSGFRLLATAINPIASVDARSADHAF